MASGYGLAGDFKERNGITKSGTGTNATSNDTDHTTRILDRRPSRCFPFWQEVLACYTTNTNAEDDSGKAKCAPVLEDYYECLHHKKEAARTLALQAAYRKAEANIKRDDAPSAGEIRRLGVLDAPLEEKNLKPSKWFPHKQIN
ncbi:hypothetical protein BM1_07037 [Bipolaris maydis]|nr:hypothetical protein BM1_07037 [Bipolaris maydis]